MMTDELKPVRCGCGGEAEVRASCFKTDTDLYLVQCKRCGTATLLKDTEAEAIQAWNRAMGERTAKVKDAARDVNGCRWGRCAECGSLVFSHYCPVCGARLEWE